MRRVAYRAVMDRVAGLLQGLASSSGNGVAGLDRTDAAVMQRFIATVTREFWERYAWPELCVTERRLFRITYAGGSTYAAEQEVWFWPTRKYYQALRAVPGDQAPATLGGGSYATNAAYWAEASESVNVTDAGAVDLWDEDASYAQGDRVLSPVDGEVYEAHTASSGVQPPDVTKWGRRTDFVRSLALEQAGATTMAIVRKVWDCDPRRVDPQQLAGHELKFDVFDGEVVVRPACFGADIVWAQFWTVTPDYSGNDYSSAATYAAGDVVFFTDGDFYTCLATTTAGQSPATTPAKWSVVGFPRVLAEMVAWRVFGEMDPLHGSGPMGDGLTMAEAVFAEEVLKLERGQGQARQLNVRVR